MTTAPEPMGDEELAEVRAGVHRRADEANARRMREALTYYARPEHWMALTDEADSRSVVWVARTHLDASADGFSTARQVLKSLAPPLTEAEVAAALKEAGE